MGRSLCFFLFHSSPVVEALTLQGPYPNLFYNPFGHLVWGSYPTGPYPILFSSCGQIQPYQHNHIIRDIKVKWRDIIIISYYLTYSLNKHINYKRGSPLKIRGLGYLCFKWILQFCAQSYILPNLSNLLFTIYQWACQALNQLIVFVNLMYFMIQNYIL